jgi:hypothetical protein
MNLYVKLLLALFAISLSGSFANAHPPTGIVIDQSGTVYFTDLETIWKIDTNGKLSIVRHGVSGRHTHELSIDQSNTLRGADLSYESQKWISSVWKMSPDGQFTYLLEPTSSPPRGMSLWTDAIGNTYVVEQDNNSKKETLLVRRSPTGELTILAGSKYGHRDGNGSSANFGSIGGMHIDVDGTIYLTDGPSVRTVTRDGVVSTVATDLTKRTSEDAPPLFGKNDGILSGLTLDKEKNIYLADAGNQRLLKIARDGLVKVVYRGESGYYPNGVAVDEIGDLYVLEVGFKPPATWLPARVRKITSSGSSSIIAVSGQSTAEESPGGQTYSRNNPDSPYRFRYLVPFLSIGILAFSIAAWFITRRSRS